MIDHINEAKKQFPSDYEKWRASRPAPAVLDVVNGCTFTEDDVSAKVVRFCRTTGLSLSACIERGFIEWRDCWHWVTSAGMSFIRNSVIAGLPDIDCLPATPTQAVHVSGHGFVDIPDSHLDVLIKLDLPIEEALDRNLCVLIRGRDTAVAGELRFTGVLPLAQKSARADASG